MKGNLVAGQSGGPTSVINGSLAGIITEAKKHKQIGKIFGMSFAIEGFMNEELIDLGKLSPATVKGLRDTPSSALGSSRLKLKDEHFPRILEVLKKYNIRYFHMAGGNDSMDTINRVEKYCRSQGYELYGVGVPKTVDNDLFGTDHTPGFPSAARFTALSVMQAGLLGSNMQRVDKYTIYQSIGRDAGWLTSASALGKKDESDAPHIIVIPERPLHRDKFLAKVDETVKKHGWVSIACGEGVKWENGTPVSASTTKDKFGNVEYGAMGGSSVAMNLHKLIKESFEGWRGEFQITESLPMCAADRMTAIDRKEAFELGTAAVKLATKGVSGVMTCLKRTSNKPYKTIIETVPLADVAVHAKPMPADFIEPDGFMVTKKYFEYMQPLVGDLPVYARIPKKLVK
ncbi:MAG: phosphofructokinase [Candidatus Raymondbacteria bacterium RifOxyA12_full_50_37]|uniref:Pyrophosphate--fructose 6-phosphate 1-phosphotransferase n=1 Tax=Candidatus Raymondbacteria bacterium RIFOXYD12_FULL_49_13 TaxID=1817890 RepID=A0A1F7F258_UNCRA|nr:MAG: phosphofructokinase [Candidatus Raymondbacteria bacterium RifOxyA12_full_50_37]OGJ92808.1 MAG: phosphofructokinase [Candidatus Raymondbacteria bacterium RIFOXYA2_FULL_49_16]OGJ95931.1 MAG: phosphofructokinase [Candidatus Raymondbacteria bacterium RifOxyC12_full_50_8]OGK00750.1 MAG: phosphofructokinase [Candidatus Raymondbacteria bacterium RIFOXYD12_FULL_49_13]OGK04204.1 MAG: phosphofructokinase [Candidatus Raymondbacteria bacterium RifOxyB12_full_50_8]OGP44584.1 MAG: phosphofructokinas